MFRDEEDYLSVAEVFEFLNEKETRVLERLCDIAEKRRHKKEVLSTFSRGYENARVLTNDYEGNHRFIFSYDYDQALEYYEDIPNE